MRIIRSRLGLRFSLIVGIILLLFCGLLSTILYHYLKAQVIRDAQDKTVIIMTQVKALGGYVRETLRPKMYDLLSKTLSEDEFIVEAMSTTHVNLRVMGRFNQDLPEYVFKRTSDRPLNPANRTDDFHLRMMRFFAQTEGVTHWEGIERVDGREILFYVRPVVSDASCLKCHGDRADVARSILAAYGSAGSFGWTAGTVVGVESVSIPLDVALARVKETALHTFGFGFAALSFLFIALYGTFRQLVTRPLDSLSNVFKGIAGGTEPLGREIRSDRNDEIGDLTESFNVLSRHLHDAQEKLRETAEIEKQMVRTEKLAALGQLSAGVAHEINNPLGGIRLCFNNLMTTAMDEGTKAEHIRVINSGLGRIRDIVRQLLDVSKNAPLSRELTSLNRILANVIQLCDYTIARKGIRLIQDLDEGMPELMVDANKLEQVFLNLIINALQATESGGELKIVTRHTPTLYTVAITDAGPGIPPAVVSRVFDPFFTTKGVGEGTGLGLTVSKAIVEQHRGSIEIETSEQGTTFTVRLPAE